MIFEFGVEGDEDGCGPGDDGNNERAVGPSDDGLEVALAANGIATEGDGIGDGNGPTNGLAERRKDLDFRIVLLALLFDEGVNFLSAFSIELNILLIINYYSVLESKEVKS
jgi:hypothetical protein